MRRGEEEANGLKKDTLKEYDWLKVDLTVPACFVR